jgi:hypothetical protein
MRRWGGGEDRALRVALDPGRKQEGVDHLVCCQIGLSGAGIAAFEKGRFLYLRREVCRRNNKTKA